MRRRPCPRARAAVLVALLASAPGPSARTEPAAPPEPTEAGREWLHVTQPAAETSRARFRLVEVRGRAGPRGGRGHDLVVALDLSDSSVLPSGMDLDGDGPQGGTDPAFLEALAARRGLPGGLLERLRRHDFDDSVLRAELAAARALLERIDLRHFRVGLVVFSERARVVAPVGSPRDRLERALAEVEREFHRYLRGTSFEAAVRASHRELVRAGRSGGSGAPPRLRPRERSVLLLSDGAPTLPVPAERARARALDAARAATVAGIRLYTFALGREAASALEVYTRMAEATGGRMVPVERPAHAIARLRRVDLADLASLRVANLTSGEPARALRVFPDGSFDAFVPLVPGANRLRFVAESTDGRRATAERLVRLREPEGGPDPERARAVLEALRRRTRETALWADVERDRSAQDQRRALELVPARPPGGGETRPPGRDAEPGAPEEGAAPPSRRPGTP